MDRLDLLGFLIITLNCNMTIVGKIWLIFMILLRMVVILVAGSPVYQDEQERFVCNTLQPGCANVCYDIFSPVSHLRFWLVQSVSVLLPSAVFSVYVLHKGSELIARESFEADGCPGCQDHADPSPGDNRCLLPCREGRSLLVPDFSSGYIVHLCLRTLMEAAFGALHYLLFGFSVPKRFFCTHSPCSGAVDCYISRPTEKSILMLFLWALSALSMLLSVADLLCSARRRTRGGPGSAGRRTDPAASTARWEERAALAHPDLWTGRQGAHSPSGQSAVSRRMELQDEDENEGLSSASDKLPRACTKPRGKPLRGDPQDPSSEYSLTPCSQSALHCPSSSWQPHAPPAGTGSAALLGTRRSEWV
uniref:Gap junction protein n=2 Tax=Rousettus aegyptiacus TaxID=9407 RepID=A0A7J8E7K4_ROUAE|nr:gap junction protein delta 4 [Rousettus aegyptiacus]